MLDCCNCHAPLSQGARELPFIVAADDGTGGGQDEVWCPQCFVWVRAPKEPKRFHRGSYAAIRCLLCGISSVDAGRRRCGQCGSSRYLVLLPKPRGLGALAAS